MDGSSKVGCFNSAAGIVAAVLGIVGALIGLLIVLVDQPSGGGGGRGGLIPDPTPSWTVPSTVDLRSGEVPSELDSSADLEAASAACDAGDIDGCERFVELLVGDCTDGDRAACDLVYMLFSGSDAELARYGSTCGGREEERFGSCAS